MIFSNLSFKWPLGVLYALLTSFCIILWSWYRMADVSIGEGTISWWFLPLLLGGGYGLGLWHLRRQVNRISFQHTFFLAGVFAVVVALVIGIESYLQARYFDPKLLDRLLAEAQANWVERGYSEAVVAGQAEHYMYANAVNYAFTGSVFISILSFAINSAIAVGMSMKDTVLRRYSV